MSWSVCWPNFHAITSCQSEVQNNTTRNCHLCKVNSICWGPKPILYCILCNWCYLPGLWNMHNFDSKYFSVWHVSVFLDDATHLLRHFVLISEISFNALICCWFLQGGACIMQKVLPQKFPLGTSSAWSWFVKISLTNKRDTVVCVCWVFAAVSFYNGLVTMIDG